MQIENHIIIMYIIYSGLAGNQLSATQKKKQKKNKTSPQLLRSSSLRFHLRVPDLPMSCSDLTWDGTRPLVPIMATRVTCPIYHTQDLQKADLTFRMQTKERFIFFFFFHFSTLILVFLFSTKNVSFTRYPETVFIIRNYWWPRICF